MKQARVAYVDGLRALAVLSVVAFHCGDHSKIHLASPLGFALRQGSHGVDLFFVLSGFCLARPALAKLAEYGSTVFDTVRYAAHRVVRIVPPYYFAIALLVAFKLLTHQPVAAADVYKPVLFLDATFPALNASFWTLPIELRWYFLFPVLLYVWVRSPRLFACIGILVYLAQFTKAGSWDLQVLPAFMLGIIAADDRVKTSKWSRWAPLLFVYLFALDIMSSPAQWLSFTSIGWQLAAFALVVAVSKSRYLSNLFAHPALAFIGTASYSIYLIHEPLIAYMQGQGVPVLISGVVAVLSGVVFWAVLERQFTSGSPRFVLLSAIGVRIDALFEFLHVPRTLALAAATAVPAAHTTVGVGLTTTTAIAPESHRESAIT